MSRFQQYITEEKANLLMYVILCDSFMFLPMLAQKSASTINNYKKLCTNFVHI